MPRYVHGRIEQLHRELMLSPAAVRSRHADRLEQLLLSLNPQAEYPYEFLYFRVTGFHPPDPPVEVYSGEDLAADLALLLERISQDAPKDVSGLSEPVVTVDELAALYNVAVRTIYRWRRKGLVSRQYLYPDGRTRRGIRQGALRRFVEANRRLVERSSRFSRLSPEERDAIAQQARQLSRGSRLSLTAAAERIARRTGRARETVRVALKAQHHQAGADPASRAGPSRLRLDQKRLIYDAYRSGQPVAGLARRFERSRASIHRIVNEMRAHVLLEPSGGNSYVFHQEFLPDDAEERILGEGPQAPADLPDDAFSAQPPPTEEEEQNLFRIYNYLKHKIAPLKKRLNPARYVPAGLLEEIEGLVARVAAVRKRLLAANLDLVLSITRQHAGRVVGTADLIGEGVFCLLRSIDEFDYSRGGRFRAFATWALMRSFAQTVPEEHYGGPAQATPSPTQGEGRPPVRQEKAEMPPGLWDRLESLLGRLTEQEREALLQRLSPRGSRRAQQ